MCIGRFSSVDAPETIRTGMLRIRERARRRSSTLQPSMAGIERVKPVDGGGNGKAGFLERIGEEVPHGGIVLDDQDALGQKRADLFDQSLTGYRGGKIARVTIRMQSCNAGAPNARKQR